MTTTRYRVVAPVVQVQTTGPATTTDGRRVGGVHVSAGELLPDGVAPAQRDHLLSLGMIAPEEVEPDPTEPAAD